MNKHHQELIQKINSDPDIFRDVRNALTILGDKWSVLILISLMEKPARFTDIETMLPGLNPRTLTSKLKALENEGLIDRKDYKEFPPRIEYSVTDKARELKPVMIELKKWAKKHYNPRKQI